MKKFRFYALAAAFCALLVGAVAVSSPIEAEAFDTNNASADVQYAAGERETYLFDPDNGKPIGEYWLFDAEGRLEAAEAGYTPAEGSSYIRAQLEGEDVKLTLSNVRPSENGALKIHAGNADVIIELIGENVLKSAGSPALNVGNIDGPESNLTITGSGSLAFEAVSRGAELAVLVENSAVAARCLADNIRQLGVEDCVRLIRDDVRKTLNNTPMGCFDLVFLDPPYRKNLLNATLQGLLKRNWLAPGALICAEIEKDSVVAAPDSLELLVERHFGQTRILIWTLA